MGDMRSGLKYGLLDFARESNEIERIYEREAHRTHAEALSWFLKQPSVEIALLQGFVEQVQPGAILRDRPGLDVTVGGRSCPRGGETIVSALSKLLVAVNNGSLHPQIVHVQYEHIHPFTDGNGRSGRALWLWMMRRHNRFCEGEAPHIRMPLLFLQTFYYQTLG